MKPIHTRLLVGGVILILATASWIFLRPSASSSAATSKAPLAMASFQEQATVAPPVLPGFVPSNASLKYLYNSLGQIQLILYSDGTTYRYIYDAHGDKISETGRTGQTWTYTYDEHQHVKSMVNPDGKLISNKAIPGAQE